MKPTPIQYFISALFNAKHSGLTLDDVCEAARHAKSAEAFDDAIRELSLTRQE